MNYSVEITPEAEKDIENIYRYIAFQLMSPKTAGQQVHRIYKMIASLEQMPFRFRRFNETNHQKDLRIVAVDKYCIFYLPNKIDHTVIIVRVIHGTRNLYGNLDIENLT